jgi:hypothetical protein
MFNGFRKYGLAREIPILMSTKTVTRPNSLKVLILNFPPLPFLESRVVVEATMQLLVFGFFAQIFTNDNGTFVTS